jgi:hypothetical protein
VQHEEGPINKLIRRASLCSNANLTLKPIFLLQRNNNAPRSFGNIGLPARPGGEQDHFRSAILNRPRLAELLQVCDELRGVGKRFELGRGAACRLDGVGQLAV